MVTVTTALLWWSLVVRCCDADGIVYTVYVFLYPNLFDGHDDDCLGQIRASHRQSPGSRNTQYLYGTHSPCDVDDEVVPTRDWEILAHILSHVRGSHYVSPLLQRGV
jgi:hypothetical protein